LIGTTTVEPPPVSDEAGVTSNLKFLGTDDPVLLDAVRVDTNMPEFVGIPFMSPLLLIVSPDGRLVAAKDVGLLVARI